MADRRMPAAKRPRQEGAGDAGEAALRPPRPPPAIEFPYRLDDFQQDSIDALEEGNSVMVAAHTSAGKTTVAIYAIAMALREKQRVIYTSPIKALSNQKYRELGERFESVGLMTGDVTIKPEADCLVMTTEILRSMLYRGSEMLREVGCVIFDEVHYMRDKIRGVAWEETIILLPDKVQFVFLSATIPNSEEFGAWIEHVHPGKKCKCIYTDYRPTPLQHFLFPSGAEGIYLVVDEKGQFKEDTFKKAMSCISGGGGGDGGKGKGGKGKRGADQSGPLTKIVKLIMAKKLSPLIVFSFSKKECEQYAMNMSRLDFNDDEEKELVEQIFNNAMDALGEDDRQLPAVTNILPLLKRGIGIHHAGLLPILKETIELLFQEQLLKVLFSTETFAMGLNMPARTVIFTSVRKFDGNDTRWLTCGEYVQMSGRAGRRGIDKNGLAIAMIDEAVPPEVIKEMTSGKADTLNSAFHLTYNMVLNVLRVEDIDPVYIMQRSFLQFQTDRNRPQLELQITALDEQAAKIAIEHEDVVQEYHNTQVQLDKYRAMVRAEITRPENVVSYLQTGRLVHIQSGDQDYDWGILLAFAAQEKVNDKGELFKDYTLDVMVNTLDDAAQAAADSAAGTRASRPAPWSAAAGAGGPGEMRVLQFKLDELAELSRLRVFVPADVRADEHRARMRRSVQKVKDQSEGSIPVMDPVGDMKIQSPALQKNIQRVERLAKQLESSECHNTQNPELRRDLGRYRDKRQLLEKIDGLKGQLKMSKKTVLQKELKAMLRVLRRLSYTDKDNIVRMKGRVATEICTSDETELLLCELVFANVFKGLDTNQCAALLSCLVNQEKLADAWEPRDEMKGPLQSTYEINKKVTEIEKESGLEKPDEEKVMPAMMDLTLDWMKGAKFSDLCKKTEIYEGSIIRMMRRLEEMLRQLAAASKVVGDEDLHAKFLEAIHRMRRDIVFANSLYL